MSHAVYAYGVVSSSTLYRIEDAFPSAEGYAEIDGVHRMTGGEAANSSVVLARLGVSVKLDGNWLGDDENGARTKALLSECQIDTTRLPLRQGFKGVEEVVFAADKTRTIFGTYRRLLSEASWNTPDKADITQAQVVSLDPFFADPARQVAETAYRAEVPVVTVDCHYDNPLLAHTSAVVIAESFIRENYSDRDLDSLFKDYQAATPGLTIFTFGDSPLWFARPGEAVRHCQPRSIVATDTTGGGDSFRAGVVYGFLNQWDDDRIMEFAAAVAAITCTRFPGVLNSPSRDEVNEFLGAVGG